MRTTFNSGTKNNSLRQKITRAYFTLFGKLSKDSSNNRNGQKVTQGGQGNIRGPDHLFFF